MLSQGYIIEEFSWKRPSVEKTTINAEGHELSITISIGSWKSSN